MKHFLASLGMFTKIKVNNNVFEDNSGPNTLCFFPLDGAVCGLFSAIIYTICLYLKIPVLPSVSMLLLSLFFVSGFLHLDGFMDCADALLSSRDREGKIRILKDSTVGAFSVISVCFLLIFDFSSLYVLYEAKIPFYVFLMVPFVSRALFSVVLFTFKPLDNNYGLLFYFREGKKSIHVIICILQYFSVVAVAFWGEIAVFYAIVVATIILLFLSKYVEKALGGINGDVVGGGVVLFEAAVYFVLAIISRGFKW